MSSKITSVGVGLIQPHPQNPRLVMREDIIESISVSLKESGFSPMHAPIVRAVNSHYEIVSGHHRVEAAKRAKLKEIPVWVAEMGDEEAFMRLATENNQGELSPLEIGVHALRAVPLNQGGRGSRGGIREYARRIGKPQPNVVLYRQAAEVLRCLETDTLMYQFLDKAQHLAAIHKAPEVLWQLLADRMLKNEWSAADTSHWVGKVVEFKVDEKWAGIFLPYVPVVSRFLDSKEFAASTVKKLIEIVERTESIIQSYSHVIDAESYVAAYHEWLRAHRGGDSWDVRQLTRRQREIIAELSRAEIESERRWNHGDWRAFVKDLEDESVALLLTDPPYGIDYQSDYKLDRREKRNHKAIQNDGHLDAVAEVKKMAKAFLPKLALNAHVLCFCHWSKEPEVRAALESVGLQVRGSLVWVKNNTGMGDPSTTFAPKHERIIHAVKGSPMLFKREADVLECARVSATNHPTEKPLELLTTLIEATTVEGELVADPFGGVASTLAAAHGAKRLYWGCEVEAEYYMTGQLRLSEGE